MRKLLRDTCCKIRVPYNQGCLAEIKIFHKRIMNYFMIIIALVIKTILDIFQNGSKLVPAHCIVKHWGCLNVKKSPGSDGIPFNPSTQ